MADRDEENDRAMLEAWNSCVEKWKIPELKKSPNTSPKQMLNLGGMLSVRVL